MKSEKKKLNNLVCAEMAINGFLEMPEKAKLIYLDCLLKPLLPVIRLTSKEVLDLILR
jgi:hypothetical protein